jgi:hypothetical protein
MIPSVLCCDVLLGYHFLLALSSLLGFEPRRSHRGWIIGLLTSVFVPFVRRGLKRGNQGII